MSNTPVYSVEIMQIAGSVPNMERIKSADASVKKVAQICGSMIEVDINVKDNKIIKYAHKINACVLGQAAAAVVAKNIVGSSGEEMRQLRLQMEAMLTRGGEAPGGKWAELAYLLPVRDFAPRHTSTLLVFDAVVACLDRIGKKTSATAG